MSDVTTQLAKAICEGRGHAWGSGLPNEYWESHAKPALEFLTSAGRLIPAGGMALTAEEWADVRTVAFTKSGSDTYLLAGETVDRLRALFPATEPTEEAPCAICSVNETNHAGVSYYHPFTTELGPFDDDGNDRPTPAEPAEEETKAEAPTKFRKKPVEVEAMQYDGKDWRSIAQWMAAHGAPMGRTASGLLRIHTLEGEMTAGSGDWIIRGVQGEFYPCKPDIFAQTYDPASSSGVPAATETEWQTWQEVPEGVKYRETPRRQMFGQWWWVNRNGIRHLADICAEEVATEIVNPVGPFLPVAPFVAAEEG